MIHFIIASLCIPAQALSHVVYSQHSHTGAGEQKTQYLFCVTNKVLHAATKLCSPRGTEKIEICIDHQLIVISRDDHTPQLHECSLISPRQPWPCYLRTLWIKKRKKNCDKQMGFVSDPDPRVASKPSKGFRALLFYSGGADGASPRAFHQWRAASEGEELPWVCCSYFDSARKHQSTDVLNVTYSRRFVCLMSVGGT